VTTPAQIQEAERLIQQKRVAERKPKLRLVSPRRPHQGYTVDELMAKAKAMGYEPYRMTDEEYEQSRKRAWEEAEEREKERYARERQEWARRILEPAGGFKVPGRYESYTPRTLQAMCSPQEFKVKKPAVLLMADWADGKLSRPGVLITGTPGTGKTVLALWAFNRRAERTEESRLLVRYGAFINAVQATYDNERGGPTKSQLMRAGQIADLLLVDDFGENALALGQAASNDKQNIVREIVDYRNMHDLPTVIISNLTTARLQAQFGEDIISRLQEHCVLVEMNGVDLRRKGAVGW